MFTIVILFKFSQAKGLTVVVSLFCLGNSSYNLYVFTLIVLHVNSENVLVF